MAACTFSITYIDSAHCTQVKCLYQSTRNMGCISVVIGGVIYVDPSFREEEYYEGESVDVRIFLCRTCADHGAHGCFGGNQT